MNACVILGCIFNSNFAGNGGAIFCFLTPSSCNISNSEFNSNIAENGGGGICCSEFSEPIIQNNSFNGNYASSGGGIHCQRNSSASAPLIGGGLGLGNTFTDNFAGAGSDLCTETNTGPVTATYNTFTGFYQSDYYVSPPEAFVLDNSISLLVPITQPVYVTLSGDDSNTGLNWDEAFRTIHHALSVVYATESNPIEIFLGEGLFAPSSNNEYFPLPMVDFVTIKGTNPDLTLISSESNKRVFRGHFDEESVIRDAAIINGGGISCLYSSPIITNCKINNNSAISGGGGILCYRSTATITDCEIKQNNAENGGGIYLSGYGLGSPGCTIERCVISDNFASNTGGGIVSIEASLILDCKILSNSCNGNGGGFFIGGSSDISGCEITNNSASSGGGIYADNSFSFSVMNCLVSGNNADSGAGIRALNGDLGINNCTFNGNIGIYDGGGIRGSDSTVYVLNCILWENQPNELYFSGGYPHVQYSDIQGGYSGSANIDIDPLFTNGPLGSHYLSCIAAGQPLNSPCLNAGSDLASNLCFQTHDSEICMNQLTTRTDNEIDSGQVDMGFHYAIPTVTCMNDGDVDNNGSISPTDALGAFQIYLGTYPDPTVEELCSGDCDGNYTITPADALCIFLHYLSGSCECSDPI